MLFSIESVPGEHLKGAVVCGLWEAQVRGHTTTLYPPWAENLPGEQPLGFIYFLSLTSPFLPLTLLPHPPSQRVSVEPLAPGEQGLQHELVLSVL